MNEKVATNTQEMWRSKLGTNYPKDFMQQNEARLLKELQIICDGPENRMCADCGVCGTVWASVNLGIFLCMTCGAHHRSLGTHISLPKGCTGTYWWGPDEIEQMKSKGNSHAEEVYGKSRPPNGVKNDDASGWKQYLTDKYVHKKFAPPTTTEQRGDEPSLPSLMFPASPRASPRLSQTSPKFSKKPMPDMDLLHFESISPPSPNKNQTSPRLSVQKTLPTGSTITGNTGEDFFAEFGL